MSRRLVVINKTTDFRDLRDLYHKRKRERSLQSVRSVVPPKTEIKGNWFVRFIWSWCSKNVIDKNQTNRIHPFPFFHQTHANVYKFSLPWGSPMLIISEYVSGWGWVFAFYSTLYTRVHINKWFIDCYGGVELHSTLHQLYILYTTYCLLKGVEM